MEKLKPDLVKFKEEILNCVANNIDDQNSNTSLIGLMSAFDLSSNETFDQRKEKIYNLYDLYGHDTTHKLEKWYLQIVYKFMNTLMNT